MTIRWQRETRRSRRKRKRKRQVSGGAFRVLQAGSFRITNREGTVRALYTYKRTDRLPERAPSPQTEQDGIEESCVDANLLFSKPMMFSVRHLRSEYDPLIHVPSELCYQG